MALALCPENRAESVPHVRLSQISAAAGIGAGERACEKGARKRGQESWSVELGVSNLFDRFYDLPLGGAYVGQGTTMTIPPEPNQPQWGTPVPGPGRSIYAAVNIKF